MNWIKKHKVLSVILGFILLGIIGSALGGSNKGTSGSGTSSATPTPAPTVVDTKAFADEFNSNQVAAESKYKGKPVQLTATISNITDTGLSFQNVSSKEFDMTQISCNIKSKNDLLSVKNGQSVTITGTVENQTFGVITLNECSIVK